MPPSSETAPEAEQPALARERPSRTAVTEKGRLADDAPALATLTADSAIHITRSRLRIDPGVANGYRHFQSGDLAAAQQEYERALRSDPRNTDALDGLAAISLRRNRNAEAAGYYQRALEADPMDATAQAGLINLRGSRDPRRTESRLRHYWPRSPTRMRRNSPWAICTPRKDSGAKRRRPTSKRIRPCRMTPTTSSTWR